MYKASFRYFLIFVVPTLLCFLFAFAVPFVYGIVLSFSDFSSLKNIDYVGFDNYIAAFTDKDFIISLRVSAVYILITMITTNICAFAFALFLTSNVKGKSIYRTMILIPTLIGGIVFGYIIDFNMDVFYSYFQLFNVDDRLLTFLSLSAASFLQLTGCIAIVYIAGLQNIQKDVLEAALIDGAESAAVLLKIKMPLLAPSFVIAFFMSAAYPLKIFDQNLALNTEGKDLNLVPLNIYNTFYVQDGAEGAAQAKAVLFFILVIAVTFIQWTLTKRMLGKRRVKD